MTELRKILYVEDELVVQTIVKLALVDLGGFDLTVCSSGCEALEVYPTFRPDLVLLDAIMPKMDGRETLLALRQTTLGRDVPIVFLTSKTQNDDLQQMRALGALDVLAKPFNPLLLAGQLQQIWALYQEQRPNRRA